MDEKLEVYLNHSMIMALMTTPNFDSFISGLEDLKIPYDTLDVALQLGIFLSVYDMNCGLSELTRSNLLQYVNILRFGESSNQEERKEKVEIANQILTSINARSGKPHEAFYRKMINQFWGIGLKRAASHLDYMVLGEEYERLLGEFAAFQYFILVTHSTKVSDEDFMNLGWEYLLSSDYLEMIDNIMDKNRDYLITDTFLSRVKRILTYNEELQAQARGEEIESDVELDGEDEENLNNPEFWKKQKKLKYKIKDS